MHNIIIIHGKKGAGKDTVADYICATYGYQKISFADPLKKACRDLANTMTGAQTELGDFYNQDIKEVPMLDSSGNTIPMYGEHGQNKDMTIRRLMQYIGTDVMRKYFGTDVHVNAIAAHIKDNLDTNWVIPDARFADEIEGIFSSFPESDITTIHLIRPEPFDAISDQHISEQPLDYTFDTIICNDSEMENLIGEVQYVMGFVNQPLS